MGDGPRVSRRRALIEADVMRSHGMTVEEQLRVRVAARTRANPLGRITETEDIAKMAAFLSSAESDYITGLAVSVSGGDVMY